MTTIKTLIGNNGYLYLINDSSKELEIHCNNVNLIDIDKLNKYTFNNYLITVYPDKSVIYKQFLPSNYVSQYRPGLDMYKSKFGNKLLDMYPILANYEDVYYKTDTHINLKGNYITYLEFLNTLRNLYNIHIEPVKLNISKRVCALNTLNEGIGDLTWPSNLGPQILDDINDTYYYSEDLIPIYIAYRIGNTDINIRILSNKLEDKTYELSKSANNIVNWTIISSYILFKRNEGKIPIRVIIFYDSFLLNIMYLYLSMFYEVYMIKSIYDNKYIDQILPNYVFEFRVERFL